MADGLLSLLLTNPHGLGDSTLKFGQSQGEIRNQDDPYAGTGGPSLPASLAYLLSGIPMAKEGLQSAREGSLAGDPIKAFGGLGKAALAAVPAGGPRLAEMLYKSVPRIAAMVGAGGASDLAARGVLSSTPAEAGDVNPLDTLYKRQADAAQQVKDLTAARDQEGQSGKGPRYLALDRQVKDATSQQAAIDNMIKAENDKTSPEALAAQKQADYLQQKKNEAAELNKPFAERHPYINEAMTLGGPTLSALLSGTAMGSIAGKGNKLVKALEDARVAGDVPAMQQAAAKLAQWNNPASRLTKQAASVVIPATAPMDMRLIGDNVDKYTLPTTSPAQQDAKARLADIPQYLKDSEQALASGLVMSGLGAKTAAIARPAPAGDARALLGLYGGKTPEDLASILKAGGDATASVQGPLGLAETSRLARAARNQQLENGSAQLRGDAPAPQASPASDVPSLSSSSEPPHHSFFQPRDKNNRFSGPPKKPKNDN